MRCGCPTSGAGDDIIFLIFFLSLLGYVIIVGLVYMSIYYYHKHKKISIYSEDIMMLSAFWPIMLPVYISVYITKVLPRQIRNTLRYIHGRIKK